MIQIPSALNRGSPLHCRILCSARFLVGHFKTEDVLVELLCRVEIFEVDFDAGQP